MQEMENVRSIEKNREQNIHLYLQPFWSVSIALNRSSSCLVLRYCGFSEFIVNKMCNNELNSILETRKLWVKSINSLSFPPSQRIGPLFNRTDFGS